MIIDFHTHCYTDILAKKAMSRIPENANVGPYFDGTLSGLRVKMEKAGIDISVCLNIANRPDTARNVNDWAIGCNSAPGIIAFGSVHPNGDYKEELKRLKDNGIKGVKVHPHYQRFYVNDKIAFPMYEEIIKSGLIMLFHCGMDIVTTEQFNTPKLFKDILDAFEGEKIVCAHLGGIGYFDDCVEYIFGRNIYIDTSISYKYTDENQRKILFLTHDNEKILFGSDMPWADPLYDIKNMKKTITNKLLYDKIMYQNAAKLLGL